MNLETIEELDEARNAACERVRERLEKMYPLESTAFVFLNSRQTCPSEATVIGHDGGTSCVHVRLGPTKRKPYGSVKRLHWRYVKDESPS